MFTKFVGDIPYNYSGKNPDSFVDEEVVRQRWWYPNIKPGDYIVDVGACYGSYLLPALAIGAKLVVAFSPESPAEFDFMMENVKMNEGFLEKVVPIYQAFYNKKGWLHFISQDFKEKKPNPLVVDGFPYHPVITFDDSMKNLYLPKIDFIKVDVEGAEYEFVQGARNTISYYKPKLLIENHLFKDESLESKIIGFIDGLGLGYKAESAPYHSISHTYFWI